jgi:nucleotide-binding universal stress UspA family protein
MHLIVARHERSCIRERAQRVCGFPASGPGWTAVVEAVGRIDDADDVHATIDWSPMPKPIIVGVDPLEPDRAPVTVGAALARLTGAPLIVAAGYLHDAITDAVSGGRVERDLREQAETALDDVAGGLAADRVVVAGFSAAHALHDLAEERNAGLLVVGSSRRGMFGRLAPGTTADRLLHGAQCPVAVAPTGLAEGWTPRRIGVGFIDLDEGHHALRAAVVLADLAGGSLEAVTAIQPMFFARGAAIAPYDTGAGSDAAREAAARSLRRALESSGRDPSEGRVFAGEPVDALVGLSDRVDLLLCGSRGYGPIESVLLGGVSHGVMRDAHCPVVVIPRGAGDAIDELAAARESPGRR